jgi:hypothetical protein
LRKTSKFTHRLFPLPTDAGHLSLHPRPLEFDDQQMRIGSAELKKLWSWLT